MRDLSTHFGQCCLDDCLKPRFLLCLFLRKHGSLCRLYMCFEVFNDDVAFREKILDTGKGIPGDSHINTLFANMPNISMCLQDLHCWLVLIRAGQ